MTESFDDNADPDEVVGPDDLNIDELLNQERPERYSLDDQEWMEPVVQKYRDELLQRSAEEVAEEHARRVIHIRDGVATQRLNTFLRKFKNGQFPLGFGDGPEWKQDFAPYLRAPLLIGKDKVQFGPSTAQDLDDWLAEKKRAGERDQVRRDEVIAGVEAIRDQVRAQRSGRVEYLRSDTSSP